MGRDLFLISSRSEDAAFWKKIAESNDLRLVCESEPERIKGVLASDPRSYVFWEADADSIGANSRSTIEALLFEHCSPDRIFALSDGPINQEEGLSRPPVFGHHILRRYDGPAPFIYSKLLETALSRDPFGLERFFPKERLGGSGMVELTLDRSDERQPALRRVEAFLRGFGLHSQIARLGVEATDELLMNAIFDAPFAEGQGSYRRHLERTAVFPLEGNERVTVRMAASEDLVGISVTDQFGSLERAQVLKHLCQDLRFAEYVPPEGKGGAGLGLHRVNQQAVALLFSSKPGVKTEVTVFLNNSKSFREFRLGFCFFSILSGEA